MSDDRILVVEELVAGYIPEVNILNGCNIEVRKGEFVGVIGPNGAGKSTVLKAILGQCGVRSGQVRFLDNNITGMKAHELVEQGVGYVPQTQNVFQSLTVSENLEMGCFIKPSVFDERFEYVTSLFPKLRERANQRAGSLSGGERQMVAMGRALMMEPKLLLLDEPTNHLDLKSKDVLKEALLAFDGTLILVSHDRDFLQGLTNKVYEFKDHKLREYLGDIDFYLEQRNVLNLREVEKRNVVTVVPKEKKQQSYEDQKKLKSLNNKLSNVESKINQLERDIKAIDVELEINYEEASSKPNFFDEYQKMKTDLQALMSKWEGIQLEIEQFVD